MWILGKTFKFLLGVTVASLLMAVIAWGVMRMLNYTPDFGIYLMNIWWATLFLMFLAKSIRFLTGR